MKTRTKAVKVWCGIRDWHHLHAWCEVDDNDEPIGSWQVCLGSKRNGKPERGQLT